MVSLIAALKVHFKFVIVVIGGLTQPDRRNKLPTIPQFLAVELNILLCKVGFVNSKIRSVAMARTITLELLNVAIIYDRKETFSAVCMYAHTYLPTNDPQSEAQTCEYTITHQS